MTGSIQQTVRTTAKTLGFHLAGIAPASLRSTTDDGSENPEPTLPELAGFQQWIDEGRAGEMAYLKRRDARGRLLRSSVQVPFPWAHSVIVCAVNYNNDQPYSIDPLTASVPEATGWIARYAWSGMRGEGNGSGPSSARPTDYHCIIRDRLEMLTGELRSQIGDFQARCFVDTGPLVERVYAKYAGIGWQGKNTCLINESIGSWFFLGVILTSISLPVEDRAQPLPDRCGSCTRCIDACPTEALTSYKMDASRCIAYLTIEKRGEMPAALAGKLGRNIFGCDICQEVCPWNNRGGKRPPVTDWPELEPREQLVNPALDWLVALDEEGYRTEFRGSPVERTKYRDFRRNVENVRRHSTQKK